MAGAVVYPCCVAEGVVEVGGELGAGVVGMLGWEVEKGEEVRGAGFDFIEKGAEGFVAKAGAGGVVWGGGTAELFDLGEDVQEGLDGGCDGGSRDR